MAFVTGLSSGQTLATRLESWSLCAFTQQNALMPVTLVAWTAVSALAVQASQRSRW